MEAVEFTDPREFRASVDPLLLRNEARHNLILGVTGTLIDRPGVYSEFYLWAVVDGGEPVTAAAMTPPWNLMLADAPVAALQVLTTALIEKGSQLPGVVGNEPTSRNFCDIWSRANGSEAEKTVGQGVYALEEVSPVAEVGGTPRRATPADRALLESWGISFAQEGSGRRADTEGVRRWVDRRLTAQPDQAGAWLWEVDSAPVSLSGYGEPTPNGIRITLVYTPPEHRNHGYATALVAAQSRWLLEQGRRFCFLYTNLANPTANAIYRRIGYRQVAESSGYKFT